METAINGEHYIPYQQQNKAACVYAFFIIVAAPEPNI